MKEFLQWLVFAGCAAVLFLPLVVSDSMFFPFITGKNFWFRIIVEVTLAAWVLLALYDPQYRPRFSWLLPTTGALLVVMFFANLLGELPAKSFWSNYERMDGYVTLVHFVGYFIVLGSVLSNKVIIVFGKKTTGWYLFFCTALVAAVLVTYTGLSQFLGWSETTMGSRINGTLGNAAYMAIYMLFNVFIALWVLVHTKARAGQVVCAFLAALFAWVLFLTATRGTLLGLAGGTVLGGLYIVLLNRDNLLVRRVSLGMITLIVIAGGTLFTFKDTAVVQDSVALQRATAINLSELDIRITIWQLALNGIEERPVLGWGQGNFNFIFNEFYNPNLGGRAEEWYDRGHNVFIDWLSVGGVLGLIAYLSIWAVLAYYVLWSPLRTRFSVIERGLLLGILAGYFIHNLVVFDNIVSYIFFAIVLALIHSRMSEGAPTWPKQAFNPMLVTQVVAPIVLVVTALTVYFVNVPSMQAATDLIKAFRASDPTVRLEEFQSALNRGGFAQQEITEQFAQEALDVARNEALDAAVRDRFLVAAEAELKNLIAAKPTDARVYVFATGFYRGLNQLDAARANAQLALQYTPNKPSVVMEQGLIEYQAGNVVQMNTFFKQAYDLNPENRAAQVMYAAGLVLAGGGRAEIDEILSERAWPEFATDRFAILAADRSQNFSLLADMFAYQVEANPDNAQAWVSLSFTQYRLGEAAQAVETLTAAGERLPAIAPATQCFIKNIEAGNEPGEGC